MQFEFPIHKCEALCRGVSGDLRASRSSPRAPAGNRLRPKWKTRRGWVRGGGGVGGGGAARGGLGQENELQVKIRSGGVQGKWN